jgi:integrase
MDEIDLAKYPGLYARSGRWYVRKRVPADLIHVEKREQIRLSLNTSDRRNAVKLYHLRAAEIEVRFADLRRQLQEVGKVTAALAVGKLEKLNHREIEGLAIDWWGERSAFRAPRVDEMTSPAEVAAEIERDAEALANPLPDDGDPVGRIADQLLVKAGIVAYPQRIGSMRTHVLAPVVDRSTAQYRYLRELVARGLQVEAALAKDHVLGRAEAGRDPLFNPRHPLSSEDEVERNGLVRDLIAEYRAERETTNGVESTARKYGLLFRVIEEVIGDDLPVRSIKRRHCVAVLDFLRKLPPNATKRFPKLTLREAMEKGQAAGLGSLAPKTVASYMQNFAAILRWGKDNGWGVAANLKGLIDTRKANVQRRAFTSKELRTLFKALRPFLASSPTRFWVPALGLFTGARLGEICQLRAEDVIEVDGIWCLELSEFDATGRRIEGKRYKTPNSERMVPLHPDLIRCGLLAFVKRQAGQRLFPDLPPGPTGLHSHDFSKWFGRFKRSIGFNMPSLVFHSFRHGFRDACRDVDIPEEPSLALGGWAGINQAQRYGNRGKVPNLHRAVLKLRFEGFDVPPPARKRNRPGELSSARKRSNALA